MTLMRVDEIIYMVGLALVSTDTRITILSNDMDLCREKQDSYVGWLVNGVLVTIEVALT